MLRERGIVNADAVAHDWLTRAKQREEVQSELTAEASYKVVEEFIKEKISADKTAYS